jgi:hypothetical protein
MGERPPGGKCRRQGEGNGKLRGPKAVLGGAEELEGPSGGDGASNEATEVGGRASEASDRRSVPADKPAMPGEALRDGAT